MNGPYYSKSTKDLCAEDPRYTAAGTPEDLYWILRHVWAKDTCAPRMQDRWSEADCTLGHCSVTSFLVQDIYGGEVYGIPLPDGNYHCFNCVNGTDFDLTAEQFRDEELLYTHAYPQKRSVHFAKAEKYERYLKLKKRLEDAL
ncbi:MAG: hypothetical protein IKG46_02700 [Solobacterium sp.]|nr:hypothetical protein [Solobacterium sp.]